MTSKIPLPELAKWVLDGIRTEGAQVLLTTRLEAVEISPVRIDITVILEDGAMLILGATAFEEDELRYNAFRLTGKEQITGKLEVTGVWQDMLTLAPSLFSEVWAEARRASQ